MRQISRRFRVSGRVQGVGFRQFVWEAARREGVTGWVRNLPDGRVEVLVAGEPEAVRRMEQAVRSGPRGSRVLEVECEAATVDRDQSAFRIRREL